MRHSALPSPINSSSWSTKHRRRLNNTTRWMPGIASRPRSWNVAGTKNYKNARPSKNGCHVSRERDTRCLRMRKPASDQWENFADVWHSDRCPPTLKMIVRTTIEEIIVRNDADTRRCSSPSTGKAVRTRNSRWSGRAPRPTRRRPWKPWRSFVGWPFATVTIRLRRVEPPRIWHGQGETVESEPSGRSPAHLFDRRSKTSATRS